MFTSEKFKNDEHLMEEVKRKEQECKDKCKLCKEKPVAYPGAVFCGAACCARWEAGDRP